jgi:hypothetical protein
MDRKTVKSQRGFGKKKKGRMSTEDAKKMVKKKKEGNKEKKDGKDKDKGDNEPEFVKMSLK